MQETVIVNSVWRKLLSGGAHPVRAPPKIGKKKKILA
jgi:hypothetical protein